MNPIANQSAQFNPAAQAIARQRIGQFTNAVANSAPGQAIQGYMAQPTADNQNPNFQMGQAAAYAPTPMGLPHEALGGVGGMFMLANNISKLKPEDIQMPEEAIKYISPVIDRFMNNKNSLDYTLNQLPNDENTMRGVAEKFIGNQFAVKAHVNDIAQELINRILVDRK